MGVVGGPRLLEMTSSIFDKMKSEVNLHRERQSQFNSGGIDNTLNSKWSNKSWS